MTPQQILKNPNSVQVMYRPVLSEKVRPLPIIGSTGYRDNFDWWKEEYRRCTEGYIAPNGKFINPIYYFYLNWCKIEIIDELDNGKKGWGSPYYRDADEVYFDEFYYNRSWSFNNKQLNAKDIIVAKGRRKGWTTAELYGINMWVFIFQREYNSTRVYPDETIRNKERRLFVRSYERLHPFFKLTKNGERIEIIVNNKETISQGIKATNSVINTIYLSTSDKKGTGVRGDALILITVVEAGIHNNLITFLGAARETLSLGGYKFGNVLIGGTSDMINNSSIDYKTLYYNKDESLVKVFTPANMCYYGAIDYFTGTSLKDKAEVLIMEERNKLRRGGELEQLKMFIQEHPLRAAEAFIPSTNSEYDSNKIDNQLIHILENDLDASWLRGDLEWERDSENKKTESVKFKQNTEGHWLILDEIGFPQDDVRDLFVCGIDDVYKDKAPHSDSLNCMLVYKKDSIHAEVSDLPVAIYLNRHPNRLLDFEEFHKGILFYNCRVMYEHNESKGFIGYAQENGFIDLFMWHRGELGIRLSDTTKADFTIYGLKYFNEDRHTKISHSSIMESFKYWGGERNSDIASAFHLVLFALEKLKDKGTELIETVERKEYGQFVDFGVSGNISRGMFQF